MNTPFRRADAQVEAALQLARVGDFGNARVLLGLPPSVSDVELLTALRDLSDGLDWFDRDRHAEAAQHLSAAATVLQHSTDQEVTFVISLVRNSADGTSRLSYGDAHSAMALLDLGAEETRVLSFFDPGLLNAAVKAKALSYLAMTRVQVNLGDIAQARQWFTKADDERKTLLALLERNDNADPFHFAAVYATRLELTLLLFRVELEAWTWKAPSGSYETPLRTWPRCINTFLGRPTHCSLA